MSNMRKRSTSAMPAHDSPQTQAGSPQTQASSPETQATSPEFAANSHQQLDQKPQLAHHTAGEEMDAGAAALRELKALRDDFRRACASPAVTHHQNITNQRPPQLRQDYVNGLLAQGFDSNTNFFVQHVNNGNFPLAAAFDILFGQVYGSHWALRRRLVLGFQ